MSIHFITFKIDFFFICPESSFLSTIHTRPYILLLKYWRYSVKFRPKNYSNQAIKNVLFLDFNLKWNEYFELSIIFFIGDFENSSLLIQINSRQKPLFYSNRVSTTTEASIAGWWKKMYLWIWICIYSYEIISRTFNTQCRTYEILSLMYNILSRTHELLNMKQKLSKVVKQHSIVLSKNSKI